MANTRIQIKRSSSTNATSLPSLFQGEFAITQNASGGGIGNANTLLYIGRPDNNAAIAVGGFYNFGVLTACQALVTNSTSYINTVQATNGNFNVINVPTQGNGQVGQILTSNGTSNLYWSSAGGGGTVTSITMGAGLTSTQSPLTTTGTMSVNLASSNPGLQEVSGGLAVLVANGLTVTATGINVLGNNGIVSNSTGTWANLAPTMGFTSGAIYDPSASQLMFGGM